MELTTIQSHKEECIICLDDVEIEWRTLGCQHSYHKKCIEEWIRISDRCPVCMRNINESELEIIHRIAFRRFLICISCVIGVIIIMVIFSSDGGIF